MPRTSMRQRNSPSTDQRSLRLATRLVTTLVGSFAFTWGFVALGTAGQVALGGDFEQAEMAMMLLAFLVFLPLFLGTFAARRQGRVMALLLCGAGGMTVAAWALQRAALT